MADKKFTITAALPYANGPLHLGHVAGVYLPSDIFARFARLNGDDVLFVCGSDEHGAAITLRAKKEGITPKKLWTNTIQLFLLLFQSLIFPLIYIIELVRRFTIKLRRIFLKNYRVELNSLKKQLINITIWNLINF